MLYLRPSFTVPVASPSVPQRRFDYATLPKDKFEEKYGYYSPEPTPVAGK